MIKIAIYARRSEEKETGESIPNQLSSCRKYVEVHYKAFKIDEYFDDDYSGRNMNRPQFTKMMKLTNEGYYDAIVFWKLDRVARNALDFLTLQKKLEDINVNIISVTEGFDPSTAAGKLMMTMLAAVAEMERKNISQRVIANMNEMAKRGEWTGGVVPYGYKVDKKYLTVDKKNIKIVEDIFSKYLETQSLFGVSKWLKNTYNISKLPTSIKRILQNLVYVKADSEIYRYLENRNMLLYGELNNNGLISYGKADKTKEQGVEFREECDWIVSVGRHEGIISGADYIRIQQILKSRNNSGRRGTGDITFLSGLCRCSYCGSYMRTKQKNNYKYFVCGKKDSMQINCANRSIRIKDVEDAVTNKLENLKIENLDISTTYIDTSLLKQALQIKQKQIKNLINKISLADDLEDLFLNQIRELKNEVGELETKIEEREKENLLLDINSYNKEEYIKELKNFKSTFGKYKTTADKRNLIKKLVKCVYIDGAKKEIRLELTL